MLLAIPFRRRTTEAGTIWPRGPTGIPYRDDGQCQPRGGAIMLGLDEALLESWKNMNTSTAPTARAYHAMAYDSANGVAVLFGGWLGNCTLATPGHTTPPRRMDQRDHLLRAAGEKLSLHGIRQGPRRDDNVRRMERDGFLNDTWTYNVSWNEWTGMSPPDPPPARQYHAMAYDSGHDEAVMFGGRTRPFFFGDT